MSETLISDSNFGGVKLITHKKKGTHIMKRIYNLLSAVMTVVLAAIVCVGCNKNEGPTDKALKQGEATLARIMNFKQQVDYYKANPAIKDGETVTLDEAIWDIEALFNLTYAYPGLSYGRTETADTVLY